LTALVAKASMNPYVPVFMFTSFSIASPTASQTRDDIGCSSKQPKADGASFALETCFTQDGRALK